MQINTLITAFRKSVCTTVSVTMLFAPTWAMGTDTNMKAIGREAQSFATEQAGDIKANPPTLVGNELQIPMKDGTSLSFGTGELSNQSDSLNRQWTPEDIAELKGLFDGSDDEGVEKGNAAKEKLFGNTNTLEGQIHQIMIDGSNQVMPDWSKDQIMIEAEKILDQYETNDITDCKTDKFLIDKSKIVHETKLEQCEQVVDRSGNCQITHDYRAGVIRHYDGPYNIESCGEGCTTIWLGKVGDNYWPGGSCKLYTDEILFVVTNPDAITRAELDYAAYDDQMQVWIGPRNREQKVYEGPNWGKFPYNDHNNDRRPGRHANSARIGFGIPRETASAVRNPPVATLSKALVPSTSPVRSRAWVRAGLHAFTCVMLSVAMARLLRACASTTMPRRPLLTTRGRRPNASRTSTPSTTSLPKGRIPVFPCPPSGATAVRRSTASLSVLTT